MLNPGAAAVAAYVATRVPPPVSETAERATVLGLTPTAAVLIAAAFFLVVILSAVALFGGRDDDRWPRS